MGLSLVLSSSLGWTLDLMLSSAQDGEKGSLLLHCWHPSTFPGAQLGLQSLGLTLPPDSDFSGAINSARAMYPGSLV